ncbi:MAG: hypothetical protein H6492_01835 [Candidatus Paracaedibacteraceae bacterium]|nr:hypothetical protein [Candidatus Paracaedibacteraceae bacterium]
MDKFTFLIGDFIGPIVFMLFVGYQIGKYSEKMALSIVVCVLIGFVVALLNVWKIMKKIGSKK